MKGTFFHQSLEFRLHAEGESWRQGETLRGTIQVKNHAHTPVSTIPSVFIAFGQDKKVKAKASDAFQSVTSVLSETSALAPGAQTETIAWSYVIPLDARITDKNGGLYVLYGAGDPPAPLGQLALKILPTQHIEDLSSVLETNFRFVKKQIAAGSGNDSDWVEIKYSPPEGRGFNGVDQLVASFKTHEIQDTKDQPPVGERIDAHFSFTTNEVDGKSVGLKIKKGKKSFERTLPFAVLLHSFNQRVNKEVVEREFQSVLDELRASR